MRDVDDTDETVISATKDELVDELWKYLESVSDLDKEAAEYVENASERKTGELTDEDKTLVKEMDEDIGFETKQCYYNSQLAVTYYAGRVPQDLVYAEGYLISSTVPVPIQHAWIEIDGTVAEITLPKHRINSEDPVYIGTTYTAEAVRDAIESWGTAEPLAGSGLNP